MTGRKNDDIKEPDNIGATAGQIISGEGRALQQVKTEYFTAVRVEVPRDIEDIRQQVLKEASMAGEVCLYGWHIKGKTPRRIEGLGIQAAMILARHYGNCLADAYVVADRVDSWELKGTFVDFEKGVQISRPFRKTKRTAQSEKMDPERAADYNFQNGVSKAIRNAVLAYMPIWLKDEMLEAAKSGAVEKLEKAIKKDGIETIRQKMIDALGKFGVSLDRAENTLGLKRKDWAKDQLLTLMTNLQTLKDGMANAATIFPVEQPEDKSDLKQTVAAKANGETPPAEAEEKPPAEKVDEDTGEIKGPESDELDLDQKPPEKPQAETEAKKPASRLFKLSQWDMRDLIEEATRLLMEAHECGAIEDQFGDHTKTGGVSPFITSMIKAKVLKDADFAADCHNKGNLARLIVRLDKLVADAKPAAEGDDGPGY